MALARRLGDRFGFKRELRFDYEGEGMLVVGRVFHEAMSSTMRMREVSSSRLASSRLAM